MGESSKYWQFVRLTSSGKCILENLEDTEAFFRKTFEDYIHLSEVPDRKIQRQLMTYISEEAETAQQAKQCLLCYISHAVLSGCRSLARRFGESCGFTVEDLLPLALGNFDSFSISKLSLESKFISVSDRVLESFDPEKSGLSTWCDRILKSHPEIKRFLEEHGVQLRTNWLILNRASTGRLKRVLRHFGRSEREIEEAKDLLNAFHQVYRAEVLIPRGKSRKPYPAPDSQHLVMMSRQMTILQGLPPEKVLQRLEQLADLFRRYPPQAPPGKPPNPEPPPSEEWKELLDQYCVPCLEKAFEIVLKRQIESFSERELRREKDQKYLEALRLFHCEGQSLSQVAAVIGVSDQPAASRLLNLKTLRIDVQIETIKYLKDSVLKLASAFRDPEKLKQLDSQVQERLDKYLTNLMESAEKESYTSDRSACQTSSLFSQTLCKILKNWREN